MGRIISVVHRVKRSAEGEARPTLVAIKGEDGVKTYKLETEQDELDFVTDSYPIEWRKFAEGMELTGILERHIVREKKTGEPKKVPAEYGGLIQGDTVVMALGGSGDRLAFAMRRSGKVEVMRIAPFKLKEARNGNDKNNDHLLLLDLFQKYPALFNLMSDRDADLVFVREAFTARQDAMKARIACEQRLYQRLIGRIFLSDGIYPEGRLEEEYDLAKASDTVLQNLLTEEKRCETILKKAVRKLAVWQNVFEPLEGVGEMIAARLIVSIGDIRRFKTKHQLKKFCGVHVLDDGRFARRRNGEVANWSPEARQALYLLGEQFNRRPNSVWGRKLLEYKAKFHIKYPQPIESENDAGKRVKKFTDGHIHKMAIWRTLTKFVEWLHREWSRTDGVAELLSAEVEKD